jgi:hypothetical protein
MVDDDAGGQAHPAGQGRVVATGVHHHVGPQGDHGPGQLGHVHVLAAGVDAAQGGQRAGVLGHHGDAHGCHDTTSFRTSFQSDRKRASP